MAEERTTLDSIIDEFHRYRRIGEGAIGQLNEEELCQPPMSGLAISSLVWHIAGNLESRFTDFLTTDGEKPWRDREGEFEPRQVSKDELEARWRCGWSLLMEALDELTEDDLGRGVTIRGQRRTVVAALQRALGHVAYHVGQIVSTARGILGESWKWLSIPPGGTSEYNENPTRERGRG